MRSNKKRLSRKKHSKIKRRKQKTYTKKPKLKKSRKRNTKERKKRKSKKKKYTQGGGSAEMSRHGSMLLVGAGEVVAGVLAVIGILGFGKFLGDRYNDNQKRKEEERQAELQGLTVEQFRKTKEEKERQDQLNREETARERRELRSRVADDRKYQQYMEILKKLPETIETQTEPRYGKCERGDNWTEAYSEWLAQEQGGGDLIKQLEAQKRYQETKSAYMNSEYSRLKDADYVVNNKKKRSDIGVMGRLIKDDNKLLKEIETILQMDTLGPKETRSANIILAKQANHCGMFEA